MIPLDACRQHKEANFQVEEHQATPSTPSGNATLVITVNHGDPTGSCQHLQLLQLLGPNGVQLSGQPEEGTNFETTGRLVGSLLHLGHLLVHPLVF